MSLFGGPAPAAAGLFGAPAAPAAGGLFGAPAGAPAAPAAGGLFGAPAGAPAAPAAGGLFGAPAAAAPAASGLFGAPAAPAAGGMFGGAPVAPAGGGLFPAAAPAAGGGLFGAPAAPGGLFGSPAAAPPGGMFGSGGLGAGAGPNMLGGLGNSVLNPSENYGLHNEDMYFRELTPQNQQRIDQIRQHVQHHKTQKNELLSTWSPDELVQREEDFRSFETRILNLGVEQKKDATLVSQLTTTTYKDINHVIEAKETVRRIAATKGHGAQGYSISGSPLTTFFREMLAQYQHEMVSCTSRLEELKHLLDGPAASSQPPLEVLQEVMQNQYKYLWSVAGDVKRKLDKAEEEEQRFVELVAQLCPDKREQVQRMLEDASQAHQNNLISNTETASVKIRKCEQLRMSGHRGAQDQQASQGLLTSGNSLTGAAPAAVGGQGSLLTPAAGQLGVPGAPAAPAGGLFGTPAAAPAGGLFGAAAPAAPAGGLFGAAAPAGGLFGAAAPAGGLFGAPSPGTDKKKNTKKR